MFVLLAYPCMSRLVRLDYCRLGTGVREADLAGLLMAVAMAAMVSPVGFPVPVAGWQALFLIATCWFAVNVVRAPASRNVCRHCDFHHGVSAAAMMYMLAAMPHGDGDHSGHSVWPMMVDPDSTQTYALPAVAALCTVYFLADSAHAAWRALRNRRVGIASPPGVRSRFCCRVVMNFGMAGMFVAGLVP